MEIRVRRKYLKDAYTIGVMEYFDGNDWIWMADTLEDKVRDLNKDGDLDDYGEKKIYGETAIPYGRYRVDMDTVSPKFSKYAFYQRVCKGKLPRLVDVKHFSGILIHVADGMKGADLLQGCIGIGRNLIKGGLLYGMETFNRVYKKLKEYHESGEEIWITIE